MSLVLIYLFKVSVSLAIVYLFYQLFLRKLTFYNWNRFYLLGYTLLSFFIAFINISPFLEKTQWAGSKMVEWVPVIETSLTNNAVETKTLASSIFTTGNIFLILFLSGLLIMVGRLVFQLFSFRRMKRKAEPVDHSFLASGLNIYQVDEKIIPFSFGNSIFINFHMHTREEMEEIIRHEFVHVRQKHTADILWSEILLLLNWYNPFAWLLKSAIRQNLEFIADNKVVTSGFHKKDYQYLLLKVMGNNQFSIAPKFNFSSLKKRITMMNKLKSARVNALRFLFAVPLLSVLLLAFRNNSLRVSPGKMEGLTAVKALAFQDSKTLDTILPPPPPPPPVVAPPPTPPTPPAKSKSDLSDVSDEYEITDREAIIKTKDGTILKYNLEDPIERSAFEKKFGKIITIKTTTPVNVPTREVITNATAETVIAPVIVTTPKVVGTTEVNVISTVEKRIPAKIATVSLSKTTVIAPVAMVGAEPVIVSSDGDVTITGELEVLVEITDKTTQGELDKFKKQMKDKGYDLDFNLIDYNDKGRLVGITGRIKSGESRGNFSAHGFEKVIVYLIRKGQEVHFQVNIIERGKVKI